MPAAWSSPSLSAPMTHNRMYVIIGTTIALYTSAFAFLLNSLHPNTFFYNAPTALTAMPILLSSSPSILPSALNFAPRYTTSSTLSTLYVREPQLLHSIGFLLTTVVFVFPQWIPNLCCVAMLCLRSSSLSATKTSMSLLPENYLVLL